MSKIKRRVTYEFLKKNQVLPWSSWRTTTRKIKSEGFPAYIDAGKYYFDLDEIEIWFKKRKVNSAA
jgi:hypothetical protein